LIRAAASTLTFDGFLEIVKLLSLIRKQFGIVDKNSFYEGKALEEVEWWISYACEFPQICWGRLRVFSDGTADACFSESQVYGFADRDSAGNFLAEDEYIQFATMDEEDEKMIGVKAAEISPPSWDDGKSAQFEYLGQY
jgi:hypothetical protein